MTKMFLRVHAPSGADVGFYPSDKHSFEAAERYKHGDIVRAIINRPRNPRHHAKLFAMLNLVWESTAVQDRYPKVENLLDALKHAMGHVETFRTVSGDVLTKPKSIAFESMDQAAFEEFYNQAVEIIATRLVPHLDREDLEKQVMEIIDGRLFNPDARPRVGD